MKIRVRKSIFLLVVYSILILCISFFTYFRNYSYPPSLFWDENYHIASSYKYLKGVMFMADHPPLGKLLVALGEYIFHPNNYLDSSPFLITDYVKGIPQGFSFTGVRFFSVLFATFSGLIFFFILYEISKKIYVSFLFSSFYLFDNALIVQSRGAMLEGIQIFFILVTILYFIFLLDKKKRDFLHYFSIGILVGFAVSVKFNGCILFFLCFPLIFYKWGFSSIMHLALQLTLKLTFFFLGISLIFIGTYYIHGILGKKVLDNKYYYASEQYKQILLHSQEYNPFVIFVIMRDNFAYINQYEAGVPKYNANKADENGSLPYTWPFGNKSINYRWESSNGLTRYLYLQGNPLIWLTGLLGVISSFLLVAGAYFFRQPIRNKRLFFLICVFLSLYVTYMYGAIMVQRVIYLYHYFVPLIFSLFLAFLVYVYLFEEALKKKDNKLLFFTAIFVVFIVFTYWFFSPLTYYQPLTRSEFLMRSWLPFWHLQPV